MMCMKTVEIQKLIERLRGEHVSKHKAYEDLFWISYMGDHSVNTKKEKAQKEIEAFFSNTANLEDVKTALSFVKNKAQKESLEHWKRFFELYQTPAELVPIRDAITKLETKMQKKMTTRKEGYIDPYTKKFVAISYLAMRTIMATHDDEKIRKACFEASQKLADTNLSEYIEYVGLLNTYAKGMGYEDFYAFKIMQEEGMTKKELFEIFDDIFEKTKFAFKDVRKLEKENPGLRKPWNLGYMMSGDFVKEADQYFPFDEALPRWGQSFQNMGVGFNGGSLYLDLLDRKGKYANGFCHWPELVHFEGSKRIPGRANFTCNVVYGQPGSSDQGYNTLFHEGGHAAHFLNTIQKDTCLNHEYPPMSTAWAETQSMFFDTVYSSYEWKSMYAKNKKGEVYPLDLFERKLRKSHVRMPLALSSMIMMSHFEQDVYSCKKLTKEKLKALAIKNFKKFTDMSEDSLFLLNVPHLYSWSSACSYHGYGLADLAQTQWRAYFKKKYGSIVDNKKVGKEMLQVWRDGSKYTFKEFVKKATGKNLLSKAWIEENTQSIEVILKKARAQEKRANMLHARETLKKSSKNASQKSKKPINLDAKITMVSGKETIATNAASFEKMTKDYAKWLNS